jgi:hypothetical protein
MAPPRPWELEARRSQAPRLPVEDPDDLLGLTPVQPIMGVRLTYDGRLINRTDEALPAGGARSRRFPYVLASAAGVLALLALAQSSRLAGDVLASRSVPPEVSSVAEAVLASAPAKEIRADDVAASPDRFLLSGPSPTKPGSSTSSTEKSNLAKPSPEKPNPQAEIRPVDEDLQSFEPAGSVETRQAEPGPEPGASVVAREAHPGLESHESGEGRSDSALSGTDVGSASEGEVDAKDEETVLPPFSKDAASAALEGAKASALSCRSADGPSGAAKVLLTFAPSGRVTSATVGGPPFAGTTVGGCIASRFRSARVPAFAGDFVTVSKTVLFE